MLKTTSKTIGWIFTAIFAICTFANGFHYSTIFLLLATFLLMPINSIRNFLKEKVKIKNGLAIALAIIFFFVGILNSPLGDSSPDISDNSSISSAVDSDTQNQNEITSSENNVSENTSSSSNIASSSSEDKVNSSVGTGNQTAIKPSDIPKYSGKPYITINNNIPNFSASELTQKGYEKYSKLDSLGRTQTALASVGNDTMPMPNEERGSISSIKPSGWKQAKYTNISGGWLYNRCHLIGWQLSAENANRSNLITGTKYLNIKGMLPFENMVADYIKETGDHVAYRITPIYDGNNLLASGVQMEAYSIGDNGESICFNVYCFNVQPGVNINYKTGSSKGPTEEKNSSSSPSTLKPDVSIEESIQMVWIPNSGSKYHSHSGCSNMKNPRQVSREEAEGLDYEPCKKCW